MNDVTAALPGVHPLELMQAIQSVVVDRSDALVLAESGNSFGWANRCLRFDQPGRYRVSLAWGSLGHQCAGVVGAARARGVKALVITGDGAMLFSHEISTAVAHAVGAIWVVLNDAAYGSCVAGQRARGLSSQGLAIPRVDFVAYARALGADGVHARTAAELEPALARALAATGPFVVDVLTRPGESPLAQRFSSFFGEEPASVVPLERVRPSSPHSAV